MVIGKFHFREIRTLLAVFAMVSLSAPQPALSSGAFVHLASAEKTRGHLKSKSLRSNLASHYKAWYFAGVAFPDAMAAATEKAGSWAHFGTFHDGVLVNSFLNDAAKLISDNCTGINASFAGATCKELVAFYLGALSHVTVDTRFDGHFLKKVKEKCSTFKDKKIGSTVQHWTDENLDAVAACKHRDYYRDHVIGKDNKFNITYPTGFILRVADHSGGTGLNEGKVKSGYKTWLNDTIKKENELVSKGVFCETALATGAAGFPNPWKACPWGSDEPNYWSNKGSSGSVADMSRDVLPPVLDGTYTRLVASLGKKGNPPRFVTNGKGWPDTKLFMDECK